MTVRIIDRRLDSRNKSSINRSRFIHRFKGQIRKAVADAIARRGIRDLENGEKIGIPGRDISEPQFRIGQGGVRDFVHPATTASTEATRWSARSAAAPGKALGKPARMARGWTISSSR